MEATAIGALVSSRSNTLLPPQGSAKQLYDARSDQFIRGEFPLQAAQWKAHLQTCSLHEDEEAKTCWSLLETGAQCGHEAITPASTQAMPSCGVHHGKINGIATWCCFQLSCGVPCGRLCHFKVHGFQLCGLHTETWNVCYITKIPLEIRLRIYRYLLPRKPLQARAPFYTFDGDRSMNLAILRVNRQIFRETTGLFYGTGPFTIRVSRSAITMCNVRTPHVMSAKPEPRPGSGNTLQDYGMQLILHEQKMKRQRMVVRELVEEAQSNTSAHSVLSDPSSPQYVQGGSVGNTTASGTFPSVGYQATTSSFAISMRGPWWEPPIPRYFGMIPSFIIDIDITSMGLASGYNNDTGAMRNSEEVKHTIFDYCDHLHRLMGILKLQSLNGVQVQIRFGNLLKTREEALDTARLLLNPFRRLRNIPNPEVTLIALGEQQPELVIHNTIIDGLGEYGATWCEEIRSSNPVESSVVFDTYWPLARMVYSIKDQYWWDRRVEQLMQFIQLARISREDDDLFMFREAWNGVVNIWKDLLNTQRSYETSMANAINGINRLMSARRD